jgi:hypothetical protein
VAGVQDVVGWSLSSRNGWIEEKVVLFRTRGIDFKSNLSSVSRFSRHSNDGHGRAVVGKHTHVPALEVRLSESSVK